MKNKCDFEIKSTLNWINLFKEQTVWNPGLFIFLVITYKIMCNLISSKTANFRKWKESFTIKQPMVIRWRKWRYSIVLFNKGMSYLPVVKKIFGLQWIKQKISYDNPSPQIKINICSNSYHVYLAGPPYGEVKYKQDTPYANYRINNYSLLDV